MANRERKAISREVFGRLLDRAARLDNFVGDAEYPRWVRAYSISDSEMMAKANTQTVILSRQARVLSASHEGKIFYVFYGFAAPPAYILGLTAISLLPSLFALAVTELDLHPNASGAMIRESLEGRYFPSDTYKGHDLDEIAALFPLLRCFEADANFPFTKDIIRTVGSYAAQTYEDGALSIGVDTKARLVGLFERGNDWVPFTLLLQGLMSFSWQGFYLEVYRCIEKMYAMPRMHQLLAELPAAVSPHDVAEILERVLAWRPREEEALGGVLRRCDVPVLDEVLDAFGIVPGADSDRAALAARAIYNARNGMVHFRPAQPGEEISALAWDKRLGALITCVEDVYHRDGNTFHQAAAHQGI